MNDGAAALVVTSEARARALGVAPMARIIGQATSGLAPGMVMMTPVEAVRKVANKVGWDLKDVDLFEINEAFSVQLVAVMRELGIEPAKVNVHGGAVALGHPIGASGARGDDAAVCDKRAVQARMAALCLGWRQRARWPWIVVGPFVRLPLHPWTPRWGFGVGVEVELEDGIGPKRRVTR